MEVIKPMYIVNTKRGRPPTNKYKQGYFKPKHPEKYKGDVEHIVYRSSWEKKCMEFFDQTPEIVNWSSEELYIPYISPKDMKYHRYYVDFQLWVSTPKGLKYFLIEVKPYIETVVPRKRIGVKDEVYEKKVETYLTNQAKWEAAENYAKENGGEFKVWTERELYPKTIVEKRKKEKYEKHTQLGSYRKGASKYASKQRKLAKETGLPVYGINLHKQIKPKKKPKN